MGIIRELTKVERKVIIAARGATTMDELAERSGCSRRYIEALVGRLVADGFLIKVEPTKPTWENSGLIASEFDDDV